MARKFLYAVALLVVVVMAGMMGLRFWANELSQFTFVPAKVFHAPPPLVPNAYANPSLWFSHGAGTAGDPARWLPRGADAPDHALPAAVFFIHPTSLFERTRWNADTHDAATNARAETFVRGLASPFNAAAEVWVPRYRQATFGAFLTDHPAGQKALDAAYGDVLAAFDAFVAGADPRLPIVLVGHSQGAFHLMRLMQERVAGRPLANRIAAAYVVGWPVSLTHDLPHMGLPACTAPDQSGCILSWQSFSEPADPRMVMDAYARFVGLDDRNRKGTPFLCTNPITGRPGDAATAQANLGTLVPDANFSGATLVPGMVSARCAPNGFLMIGSGPQMGPLVLPGNNYHVYDIPLFWGNVRADVARRVGAWHTQSGQPAPKLASATSTAGKAWWRLWQS